MQSLISNAYFRLRNFVLALLLILASSLSQAGIEDDKLLHFSVSFGIGASFGTMYSPQKACAISLIPGLAKEIYDKLDDGLFSFEDIVADGIGGCIGAYVSNRFSKQYKRYKEINKASEEAGATHDENVSIYNASCPDASLVRMCNAEQQGFGS